jgi:hypothetical protein
MELLPYQIIETDLPMQIEMVQLFEKDQQMKVMPLVPWKNMMYLLQKYDQKA